MRRVTRGKLWHDWNTPGFLYISANGIKSMALRVDTVATWTVGGWREGHGGSGARVTNDYTVKLAIVLGPTTREVSLQVRRVDFQDAELPKSCGR